MGVEMVEMGLGWELRLAGDYLVLVGQKNTKGRRQSYSKGGPNR
jgi:hypothetical protein